MISSDSRIRSDVDIDTNGKRSGYLHVPVSTNESAYGLVQIPVWVVKNGSGPTILLTGAVHGDEYEGPLVLHRLARELDPSRISGRLIIIPALNLPALAVGRRLSPLDGLNLNRVFPGRREGSITEMIAHFVTSVLFPEADIVVDLHSGGTSLLYAPLVGMHQLADPCRNRDTLAALMAFGAPIGLIGRDLDDGGLLDYTAEKSGKLTISTELGGAGIVSREAVAIGERGVWNLLRHFGLIEPQPDRRQHSRTTRLVETPDLGCFIVATDSGLYEPNIDCSDDVAEGGILGFLHHIDRCDLQPDPIVAPRDGVLICRRAQGFANRGDCLGIVASDIDQKRIAELMGS